MAQWWDGISLLEQIFFIIAAPATLIIAVQTLLLIFGGGMGAPDSGLDSDVSGFMETEGLSELSADGGIGDAGIEASDVDGLRIFSIRGVTSFLTVFGWSGFLMLGTGIPMIVSMTVALVLGIAALFAMVYLVKALMKLQESGTMSYRDALGKTGTVYLTIPPRGGGQGKINVMLGEAQREFRAVTSDTEAIPNGAPIRIVELTGDLFTVERLGS